MCIRDRLKHWKASLSVAACVVVALAGLGFATKWALFARIPSLVGDLFSVFSDTSAENYLDKIPVRDIQSRNGNIVITTQQDTLTLSFDGTEPSFTAVSYTHLPEGLSAPHNFVHSFRSHDCNFPTYFILLYS